MRRVKENVKEVRINSQYVDKSREPLRLGVITPLTMAAQDLAVAFDPADGKLLWNSAVGQVTNAPETYMVDGRQYLLVGAGDSLFAFALYQ